MKNVEPIVPKFTKPEGFLAYWAIITPELDDLGLTKAEFRIFCHILRRAGPPRYVCYAGIRKIAEITRTHPVYVKWVIRHLVHRKLILRTKRPGQTSELRPAEKFSWLNAREVDRTFFGYEERPQEAAENILWQRLWNIIPDAKKIRYEKRMREHPRIFESVLADVEERVKRGSSSSRYYSDRLPAVRDTTGLFEFTWKKFMEANK